MPLHTVFGEIVILSLASVECIVMLLLGHRKQKYKDLVGAGITLFVLCSIGMLLTLPKLIFSSV